MTTLLVFTLLLVLAAEFINGWTDAPNAIATVVATRVLPPRTAVVLAVILNTLGAMSGTAVAQTVGKGIVKPEVLSLPAIGVAMASVILWGCAAAWRGWPISKSHALLAALGGVGIASGGKGAIIWSGWWPIFLGMGLSLLFGFCSAWLLGKTVIRATGGLPRTLSKRWFDHLQIASVCCMAFSHGLNDGQKFIGVFVLTLFLGGVSDTFAIPAWVVLVCAATMGIGTSLGGWRIIRTLGKRLGELESWQGFAAESSASLTIVAASSLGVPLSTTHTITASITGAAASRRIKNVRWNVLGSILFGWVLTFLFCGPFAYILALILA
ncbi:MAG: inorganic phosphate transporter [Parcubacteria group bacterium]|nr:inorganic phosphate transporter [Parcubacteria group bacterium]